MPLNEDVRVEAVLLTGLFGVGKSTVAAEMADLLEDAGVPYAALDLDWLTWCNVGDGDQASEHAMLLRNLDAVVANYRSAGVRYFVLAAMDPHPRRARRPGRHDGDASAHRRAGGAARGDHAASCGRSDSRTA